MTVDMETCLRELVEELRDARDEALAELAAANERIEALRERSARYRDERKRARASLELLRIRHQRVLTELRQLRKVERFVSGMRRGRTA